MTSLSYNPNCYEIQNVKECAVLCAVLTTCEGYLGTGLFKGNKNADQRAQKRAKTPFMGPGPTCGIGRSTANGIGGGFSTFSSVEVSTDVCMLSTNWCLTRGKCAYPIHHQHYTGTGTVLNDNFLKPLVATILLIQSVLENRSVKQKRHITLFVRY